MRSQEFGICKRIGSRFLRAGPGYGGSCFPKDTLALVRTAQDARSPLNLVEHVVESNKKRKKNMYKKILNALGDYEKKKISILGLTFKPNTDDMRDSPSLDLIPELIKKNCFLKLFDPEGMKEAKIIFKKFHKKIEWCNDSYDACDKADALVILTEWNQFRALDLKKIKKLLNQPIIIDFRNIYNPEEVKNMGFKYYSLGRNFD